MVGAAAGVGAAVLEVLAAAADITDSLLHEQKTDSGIQVGEKVNEELQCHLIPNFERQTAKKLSYTPLCGPLLV